MMGPEDLRRRANEAGDFTANTARNFREYSLAISACIPLVKGVLGKLESAKPDLKAVEDKLKEAGSHKMFGLTQLDAAESAAQDIGDTTQPDIKDGLAATRELLKMARQTPDNVHALEAGGRMLEIVQGIATLVGKLDKEADNLATASVVAEGHVAAAEQASALYRSGAQNPNW